MTTHPGLFCLCFALHSINCINPSLGQPRRKNLFQLLPLKDNYLFFTSVAELQVRIVSLDFQNVSFKSFSQFPSSLFEHLFRHYKIHPQLRSSLLRYLPRQSITDTKSNASEPSPIIVGAVPLSIASNIFMIIAI